MTLSLPPLQISQPVVDGSQRMTRDFQRQLDEWRRQIMDSVNTLETTVTAVAAAQAAATAANAAAATAQAAANTANTAATNAQTAADEVTAESSLANSYVTGLTLSAADAGADTTITISAHTRVYGNGTSVAVNGGSIPGVPYGTAARIYYDDAARTGGAVTYQYTTSLTTAAQTGDRHSVGAVTTPAAAAPPNNGNPVFPPGYAEP